MTFGQNSIWSKSNFQMTYLVNVVFGQNQFAQITIEQLKSILTFVVYVPRLDKSSDNEIYGQFSEKLWFSRKPESPKIFINQLFSSTSTLGAVTSNIKMEWGNNENRIAVIALFKCMHNCENFKHSKFFEFHYHLYIVLSNCTMRLLKFGTEEEQSGQNVLSTQ